MALARVVAFDGVTNERIEQLRQEIGESGRPDEIPATEILILHDPDAQKSLAIVDGIALRTEQVHDSVINAGDSLLTRIESVGDLLADRILVLHGFRIVGEVENSHRYEPTSAAVMNFIHAVEPATVGA